MKRYIVNIRKSVEPWEIPSDIWDDGYYPEDYIEAEDAEEAEQIARDFIRECDGDPDAWDYLVEEWEES